MFAVSVRVASEAFVKYASATVLAVSTIARVRSENQVSRPRLRVTVAKTATKMAGTSAMMLKSEISLI